LIIRLVSLINIFKTKQKYKQLLNKLIKFKKILKLLKNIIISKYSILVIKKLKAKNKILPNIVKIGLNVKNYNTNIRTEESIYINNLKIKKYKKPLKYKKNTIFLKKGIKKVKRN